MTQVDLALEVNCDDHSKVPTLEAFQSWVEQALMTAGDAREEVELSIRVVDSDESQAFNAQYRNKDKPTNILSFPADVPEFIELPLLGDLIICAPVVVKEAAEQGKPELNHWAHMTVHGCLHLLGYDHQNDQEAEEMEALETQALAHLDIPNPYLI